MKSSAGLPTILILSYIFVIITNTHCIDTLQENAKGSSLWEKFHWNLTLHRDETDRFSIIGVISKEVQDLQVKGANCRRDSSQKRRHWFEMHCKCNSESPSLLLSNSVQCVPNIALNKGCGVLVPGSYSWRTGWLWDGIDDALVVMNMAKNTMITTALNITTNNHPACVAFGIARLQYDKWVKVDNKFFAKFQPVLFKLKQFWHISWDVEKMNNKEKNRISGYMLKLMVDCSEGIVSEETFDFISCLVIKVSGTSEFSSTFKGDNTSTSTSPTIITTQPPTTTILPVSTTQQPWSYNMHVLVGVGVALGAVLVILAIIITWCYCKRKACFHSRRCYNLHGTLSDIFTHDETTQQSTF